MTTCYNKSWLGCPYEAFVQDSEFYAPIYTFCVSNYRGNVYINVKEIQHTEVKPIGNLSNDLLCCRSTFLS